MVRTHDTSMVDHISDTGHKITIYNEVVQSPTSILSALVEPIAPPGITPYSWVEFSVYITKADF